VHAGIIVRAQRAGAVEPRPLKLIVRPPHMTSPGSMRCSTCQAADLVRYRGGRSFTGPTHVCPSCGGRFHAAVFTPRLWRPAAILIVGGALFIGIAATHLLDNASPFLRIAVFGGGGGYWSALAFRSLHRAVEFRACE
jgi:hypothetical protein